MSLSHATDPVGNPIALPGDPPYLASELIPLAGVDFDLPCGDPWLLNHGEIGHGYLDGARNAWDEYPEWMDFLDDSSPCHELKQAERDLYLHWWRPWLGPHRVLDVGCGIGRLTMPFLDRGAEVVGIDGDLESLRRLAWHAAGRPGRLDLHWTSARRLPEVRGFDVAIACEVLCYVPEVEEVVAAIVDRLRPGGSLLVSVESRWGWAASEDAPSDSLEEALAGEGVVHKPGDRWVRTYTDAELAGLLEGAGLEIERLVATHYVTDGPLERCAPDPIDLATLVRIEQLCREHPVWGPLNRAWTAVATKPA